MSSPAKAMPSRAAEIVGAANVATDPRDLAAYEIDGVKPGAAARPAAAEEVAELVKFAAAEKLAVIPCGARTKLGIGMPPARYDLAIDMTRLDRVISHDPGDLTLSVEAGIPLAHVAATLAEHRQFLPLAVPFFGRETIGGTLASGVDSPLRQAYGTARDFVLGMEVVAGDGALTKSGGRVVKNVSGYDLHKLMLGAIGTLGIITRVNFKTFPLPAVSRGFLATFDSAEEALALRAKIALSPISPVTLDILSPGLARLLAIDSPKTNAAPIASAAQWLAGTEWVLTAAVEGSAAVLDRCARELATMAKESGAKDTFWLNDAERPLVWERLRVAWQVILDSSPAAAIVKLSTRPSNLGGVLDFLASVAEQNNLANAVLARGAGIVYCALLPNSSDANSASALKDACAKILVACGEREFRAAIPWCPLELKRALNIWGAPREDFPLMQRAKQAFDPHNIFAPGRFVGGL